MNDIEERYERIRRSLKERSFQKGGCVLVIKQDLEWLLLQATTNSALVEDYVSIMEPIAAPRGLTCTPAALEIILENATIRVAPLMRVE